VRTLPAFASATFTPGAHAGPNLPAAILHQDDELGLLPGGELVADGTDEGLSTLGDIGLGLDDGVDRALDLAVAGGGVLEEGAHRLGPLAKLTHGLADGRTMLGDGGPDPLSLGVVDVEAFDEALDPILHAGPAGPGRPALGPGLAEGEGGGEEEEGGDRQGGDEKGDLSVALHDSRTPGGVGSLRRGFWE
jgi:hypothetical protein